MRPKIKYKKCGYWEFRELNREALEWGDTDPAVRRVRAEEAANRKADDIRWEKEKAERVIAEREAAKEKLRKDKAHEKYLSMKRRKALLGLV